MYILGRAVVCVLLTGRGGRGPLPPLHERRHRRVFHAFCIATRHQVIITVAWISTATTAIQPENTIQREDSGSQSQVKESDNRCSCYGADKAAPASAAFSSIGKVKFEVDLFVAYPERALLRRSCARGLGLWTTTIDAVWRRDVCERRPRGAATTHAVLAVLLLLTTTARRSSTVNAYLVASVSTRWSSFFWPSRIGLPCTAGVFCHRFTVLCRCCWLYLQRYCAGAVRSISVRASLRSTRARRGAGPMGALAKLQARIHELEN